MLKCRPVSHTLSFVFLFVMMLSYGHVLAATVDDPPIDRDEFLEHRRQEAARKEVLTKGLLQAQAKATANQALYDVHFYDLDLTLDPTAQILTGVVSTTAEVTGDSIASLDLDLWSGMDVTAATVGGLGTTFSRNESVLTVGLDRTYLSGESVTVTVSYFGNPVNPDNPLGASFGWSSAYGQPMIWTLSEPFGARDW